MALGPALALPAARGLLTRPAPVIRTPSGLIASDAEAQKLVERDECCLAPAFRRRLDAWAAECARLGHPLRIWETCRSHQLAEIYYALGRSKSPNGWRTWHFYALAADVIHPTKLWDAWTADDLESRAWRATLTRLARTMGLEWGGEWSSFKDWPHMHWAECASSPSDRAISLYKEGGREAVWKAVGAS